MKRDECSVGRTHLDGHESDLRELLREYFTEAEARALEWFENDFSGADIEANVASDLDRLASPVIEEPLFLALAGDTSAEAGDAPTAADIVGNVQLKRLDETTAEVKRLYVIPEYRGEGLGRRLMEAVLDGAADDGFETLRLGVGPYLERARSLYEDLGFEYTPPYGQTGAPEEIHDQWRFMRRSLDER
jgi:GNAT superfamily N-acetyltransferase